MSTVTELLTLLQTKWSCLISSSKSTTFFRSSLASSSATKAFSASKSVVSSAFCCKIQSIDNEIIIAILKTCSFFRLGFCYEKEFEVKFNNVFVSLYMNAYFWMSLIFIDT